MQKHFSQFWIIFFRFFIERIEGVMQNLEKSPKKAAQNWGKNGEINLLNLRSSHFSVRFPKKTQKNLKSVFQSNTILLHTISLLLQYFNCVLRGPDDYTLTSIPSGFMAGIFSSLFFSSKSLSLYLFWKTIEVNNQ